MNFIDRVGQKVSWNICPYLCKMLSDFQNPFADTLWKICNYNAITKYFKTPQLCQYTT